MDLTSILNTSDDRDNRPSDAYTPAPTTHPARRQPPPPLSTHRSSSNLGGGYPLSAAPAYDRQSSAIAQSPGGPYSASSHTPTPHSGGPPSFPSPFPRHAPPPSPSQKQSTPSSYFAPQQRPVSNHSGGGGRPSSSPFDHPPAYAPAQSPTIVRHNSYHHAIASPVQAQPQTPLAPPPLPRAESSSQSAKDAPYGLLHHRSPSSASLASPHRPQLQTSRSYSYSASDQQVPPPHINGSPDQSRRRSSGHSHASQRHHSVSVSPKTVIQPLPPQQQTQYRLNSAEPSQAPPLIQQNHSEPHHTYVPPTIIQSKAPTNSQTLQPAPEINKDSPRDSMQPQTVEAKQPPSNAQMAGVKRPAENDAASPAPPVKRPRKVKEPPIWAQPKKGLRPISGGGRSHSETNGDTKPSRSLAGVAIASADFEPSITNIIPSESLLRQVSLFLFHNVVMAPDDAPFEIEAKIGTLCEPGTSDRIQLPVQSEVILDESLPLKFESLMDEAHHQNLNRFLNQLTTESKYDTPGKAKRVRIDYKHKREVDELFELPPESQKMLAQPLQHNLQHNASRFKPRVRVTRDQQSGAVLAKIVKSRVADLNIYCPGQPFDYRISINLEQEWPGDLGTLKPAGDIAERIKDRLSYSHQWCQVDLTQVRTHTGARKVHELEVELDTAKLREQGRLAREGNEKNMMEDVIRVFLDNVRTLVRFTPPAR